MLVNIRAVKFFFLVVTVLVTAACENKKKDPAPNPYPVDPNWNVNEVSVTCSDSSRCPEALGVLFTINTTREYYYGYVRTSWKVHRCTAALYEANKIVTAGHCTDNHGADSRSWFRTVATPGKPSRSFPVSRVLKQVFNDNDTLTTDYAAAELAVPANGYTFVRGPNGPWPADQKLLTAVVANQYVGAEKSLTIDPVECEYDAESGIPDVSEFPDVFAIKKCKLVNGNSGGPIFARGDLTTVLGVASRSSEGKPQNAQSEREVREMLKREAREGKRRNTATFANASCFDLPGWPRPASQCIKMSEKLFIERIANRAAAGMVESLVNEMEQWMRANPSAEIGGATVKLAPWSVGLTKSSWVGLERTKETYLMFFPYPLCVERGQLADSASLRFSAKAKKSEPSLSGMQFTDSRSNPETTGSLILQKSVLGKWTAKFTWSQFYEYSIESRIQRSMTNGEDVTEFMKPCTGNEQAEILARIRSLGGRLTNNPISSIVRLVSEE